MSNYTDKVLELVQQRPGLRSVQISDLLDVDLDIVENVLTLAVRDGKIAADEVKGANGLPTKIYNWVGIAPLGWVAPKSADAAPAGIADTAAVSAQSEATAPEPVAASKASIAFDHLVKHGPTDGATLKVVMGLNPKYAVSQFLKPALKSGKIVRIGGVYCVPDRLQVAPPVAPVTHHPACDRQYPSLCHACDPAPKASSDPVIVPTGHPASGLEVVDMLRAQLSADEFRGFLKGNVIKCTLAGADYQLGSIYASLLASVAPAQAA